MPWKTYQAILGLSSIVLCLLLMISLGTENKEMFQTVRLIGTPVWTFQLLGLTVRI